MVLQTGDASRRRPEYKTTPCCTSAPHGHPWMMPSQRKQNDRSSPGIFNASRACGRGARSDDRRVATPIYQTTSYVFDDADHAASLFGLQQFGNIYTRIGNPTQAVLEERVAALEGGTAALATASGHAAQMICFHSMMQPGDEFIAARQLYGGSVNQFGQAFKNFGWHVKWADARDPESFRRLLHAKHQSDLHRVFANPGGIVVDIEAIGAVAKMGIPLIVDNTLATPYLIRPIEWGADIVIHSLTKFLGGHGNSIGGMIVDAGTFDWSRTKKYPMLSEPCPSYHGIKMHETFGDMAFAITCRVLGLRDIGSAISPFDAFLLLTGIETLPLRMQKHCQRQGSGAAFEPPSEGLVGDYANLPNDPCYGLGRRPIVRRARARSSPSGGRAAMTPASDWRPTSSCSRISPMSATPVT